MPIVITLLVKFSHMFYTIMSRNTSLCFFRLGLQRSFVLQQGQETSKICKKIEQVVHRFWPVAYLKILNFFALYLWHSPLQANYCFFWATVSLGLYSLLFFSQSACNVAISTFLPFISTSLPCNIFACCMICSDSSSKFFVEISAAFCWKITSSFLLCARICSMLWFCCCVLNLVHRNYNKCYNT